MRRDELYTHVRVTLQQQCAAASTYDWVRITNGDQCSLCRDRSGISSLCNCGWLLSCINEAEYCAATLMRIAGLGRCGDKKAVTWFDVPWCSHCMIALLRVSPHIPWCRHETMYHNSTHALSIATFHIRTTIHCLHYKSRRLVNDAEIVWCLWVRSVCCRYLSSAP